jgi:hypothetical protein
MTPCDLVRLKKYLTKLILIDVVAYWKYNRGKFLDKVWRLL